MAITRKILEARSSVNRQSRLQTAEARIDKYLLENETTVLKGAEMRLYTHSINLTDEQEITTIADKYRTDFDVEVVNLKGNSTYISLTLKRGNDG